jgi:hypothetical protein
MVEMVVDGGERQIQDLGRLHLPASAPEKTRISSATSITVGNGHKTPFWKAPWLIGIKPKTLAPLVSEASKIKKWSVKKSLEQQCMDKNINMGFFFSVENAMQFVNLWCQLANKLDEVTHGDIIWSLPASP